MAVALGLGFIGCGEEKAYTMDYYINNIPKMEKKLEFCKTAEKLSAVEEKNCQNANQAYSRLAGSGQFIDLNDKFLKLGKEANEEVSKEANGKK